MLGFTTTVGAGASTPAAASAAAAVCGRQHDVASVRAAPRATGRAAGAALGSSFAGDCVAPTPATLLPAARQAPRSRARHARTAPRMATGTEKSVPINLFKPNAPYEGTCVSNELIVGENAPGETNHIVIRHDGQLPYAEGQSCGVIAAGTDAKGKPHKIRLYSIASTARGDMNNSETLSLVVKRLIYYNEQGEEVRGVCSNYLCDLAADDKVKLTGPIGKEMLMPADENATIIMLATGTGIAPFRAFLQKAFAEEHEDYNFKGRMMLFFGVPTTSTLLYKDELEDLQRRAPDQVELNYAISREMQRDDGGRMYLQHKMAERASELWQLYQQPNTYVYMCGLKGMEGGIDEFMTELAEADGVDWTQYKKEMKKAKRYQVEVY